MRESYRTSQLLTLDELEKATPLFRGRCGNAFCRTLMRMLSIDKVLEEIGVEYEILNPEVLRHLPHGPFITISNHPYGHIDGVMLVDLFGHIRPDFKVMVNKFLGRIEALQDNFICVTPTGEERAVPTKDSLQGVKEALAHIRSGGVLGLFPSGAVSDLSVKEGCIRDREWQEPVMRLIKKLNVPIVPVHFLDNNSYFYYSLGLIDWRLRLLRLVPEVFNKRGKRQRIAIGEIISPEIQTEFTDLARFSIFLRNKVYNQY